jgi:hypothetical protein
VITLHSFQGQSYFEHAYVKQMTSWMQPVLDFPNSKNPHCHRKKQMIDAFLQLNWVVERVSLQWFRLTRIEFMRLEHYQKINPLCYVMQGGWVCSSRLTSGGNFL